MARTRLAADLPYRTATLIVAANLPDLDVLAYFGGPDAALMHRRGLTHGPLGLLLLPPLLVAGLALWQRLHRQAELAEPLPWRALLGLAYVATISHPLLDWLNTYGVRLLSPFSDRWFYGDALFIVDPWFWLILAAALFLGTEPSRRLDRWWLGGALLASALMLAAPVSAGAKGAWLLAILVLAPARRRLGASVRRNSGRWAAVALLLWLVYIGAMVAGAHGARDATRSELRAQGLGSTRGLMVGPLPGTPWTRDVVVELQDHYRIGRFSWFAERRLELRPESIAKPTSGTVDTGNLVTTALTDPSIAGFMNWVRFPYVELQQRDDGVEVFVIDARYLRRRPRGPQDFGGVSVVLPDEPD